MRIVKKVCANSYVVCQKGNLMSEISCFAEEISKILTKYCIKICNINGLDTYIISPQYYGDILADTKLLDKLSVSIFATADKIKHFINIVKTVDNQLLLAFVYYKNYINKFAWVPLNCYENEMTFYHVHYRDSWLCRECGYSLRAHIIMPINESDPIFYSGTKNQYPPISSVFKKIPCPRCKKLLQNHLLILN